MTGRHLLLFFLVFFGGSKVYGQQKPVFSQYMFNPLAINPAFAGSDNWFSATALYRDQWVNLEGSPTTSTFSIHTGISTTKVGLGVMVFSDQIGVHDDLGVYTSYSYFIEFPGTGRLYLGLQAGFNTLRSDFGKLRLRSPNDPLLTGVRTITNPNFGSGALFKGRNFFVSLSVPYLLNNSIVNQEGIESIATEKRNFYFFGGGTIPINAYLKVKPSTLVRMQEGNPLSVDVNAEFVIQDRVSFGASYRSIDAWVFLFEFEISEALHIGYAYDAIRSDLNQFSRGSHEVMINYRFRIEPVQQKGIDCPSYW